MKRYVNETKRLYGVLDKHLKDAGTEYLVGNKCTIAGMYGFCSDLTLQSTWLRHVVLIFPSPSCVSSQGIRDSGSMRAFHSVLSRSGFEDSRFMSLYPQPTHPLTTLQTSPTGAGSPPPAGARFPSMTSPR